MNQSHVDLNQINNLLNSDGLSNEEKARLEAFKNQYEALANQVSSIQESLANLTKDFNKTNEEVKLRQEKERVTGILNYYQELNKKSLTDYEVEFRKAMMTEDGTGLIQKLFACIEKDPRYSKDQSYLDAKKEIEEAFKNPFDMKKFAKKQEEFMTLHAKYKELTTKDPNNFAEISKTTQRLGKLKNDIMVEANKYIFNKKRLETLYEKNIHKLSLMGGYAISEERDQIMAEINKVYKPFHDRFDSERMIEGYTPTLANIEFKMNELGVKPEEVVTPEVKVQEEPVKENTPVQETPVVETPAFETPAPATPAVEEEKTHSGLHFVGLPDDEYYDSVRNLYRYGDEIEIDHEEEIDGTKFVVLKGSNVKVDEMLFNTTEQMENEFRQSMKAHKKSTNKIKPGMKVTPCWPGHYNKAVLRTDIGRNTADDEAKNMKLHDEITVEKVFYRGTRKFLKLEGYTNDFSADSFAIAPSTIKEIQERKEAEKEKHQEVKPETMEIAPKEEEIQPGVSYETTAEPVTNEIEQGVKYDTTVEEVKEETVRDILSGIENEEKAKDEFFTEEDQKAYQEKFDGVYEEVHGRKPVTNVEPSPNEDVKSQATVYSVVGLANNEKTPLRVRVASLWSTITSKSSKFIADKLKDLAQKIEASAQATNDEEIINEVRDAKAEIEHQAGIETPSLDEASIRF